LDKCLEHLLPPSFHHNLRESAFEHFLIHSLDDLRTLWKYSCVIRKIMGKKALQISQAISQAAPDLSLSTGALCDKLQKIGEITHWFTFEQGQFIKTESKYETESKTDVKFLQKIAQFAEMVQQNVTAETKKGFRILEKWFPGTGFSKMGVLLKSKELKYEENSCETALKEWLLGELNATGIERKFHQDKKTKKDMIEIRSQIVFELPDEILEDCITDWELVTFSQNMVERLILDHGLEELVTIVERLEHDSNAPASHLTLKNRCLGQCHLCHQFCGKLWLHKSQHYCSTTSPCPKHPIHKDLKVGARASTLLLAGLIGVGVKEAFVRTLDPKEALCPWCDRVTWHVPYTANICGRHLFLCDCNEKTLTCAIPSCFNMTKSRLGYDDNFCPTCFF